MQAYTLVIAKYLIGSEDPGVVAYSRVSMFGKETLSLSQPVLHSR